MARKSPKRRAAARKTRGAPKKRKPSRRVRSAPRKATKAKPRAKPPRSVAAAEHLMPTPPEPSLPPPAMAPVEAPVELARGSPEWIALDESVRRVESAYSLKFEEIHRRLDSMGLRERPFHEILGTVVRMTGVPEFYAWMIVRSYAGFDTDDPEAARLRAYMRSRKR